MPTIEQVLKTDLAFTSDLGVTASGDFDVMTGLVNVKEAILRRMLTKKGSIVHRPNYGVGLIEFKNAPATLAVRQQLASRVAAQLTDDPRIESVQSVSIIYTDASPESLIITVRAKLVGYGESEFTYTPFNTRV